jgi:hypothetical protein
MSPARLFTRKCAKQLLHRNAVSTASVQHARHNSRYFPIDDKIFGLTEEQQQVQSELVCRLIIGILLNVLCLFPS